MEGKVCDTLILTSVRMEGKVCDTLTLTSVRMEGKLRDTYTDTTLCENGRQSLCHIDTALRGWKSAVLTQTVTDTLTQTHTVAHRHTQWCRIIRIRKVHPPWRFSFLTRSALQDGLPPQPASILTGFIAGAMKVVRYERGFSIDGCRFLGNSHTHIQGKERRQT